jgi:hypothetical protein
MPGFTKLQNSILTSSIWMEDPVTKVVWITLLAMADQDGIVDASTPGLARMAGVTVEEAQSALEKFFNPDNFSRTPDNEGRRIEFLPEGGWRLLNHGKYREKLSLEDRRERARVRKQTQRDRQKMSREVMTERDSHSWSRKSRHTEADADSEAETEAGGKEMPPAFAKDGTDEHLKDLEPIAKVLLKRLSEIASASVLNKTCQAIDILMTCHKITAKEAAEWLYTQRRQSGCSKSFTFWLEDDGIWKSAPTGRKAGPAELLRSDLENEGYE